MIGAAPLLAVVLAASGTTSLPIVNGAAELGMDPVVGLGAIFGDNAFSACTGTLITPQLVLTAGHCGAGLDIELIVALGSAFFGDSVGDAFLQVGFTNLVQHPGYEELVSGPDGTESYGEHDVSVLTLADEVTEVEPALLRRRALTSDDLGAEILSVGFGTTDGDGSGGGQKRSAVLTVDQLWQQFIISDSATNANGANICGGDSGGPQFEVTDGRLVEWAVHSWGDGACLYTSGSTRVDEDHEYEWILDQVEDVHGSRDLCEINGFYDDGWCDEDCPAVDGDCVEGDDDDDTADEDDGRSAGCSSCDSGGGAVALLPLLAAPLLRRRRFRARA